MGFLEKASKRKRTRKRIKEDSVRKSPPIQTISFIAVEDEYPPNTENWILVWEPELGHDVIPAHIVRDHIIHDKEVFGYNRVTHWAHLVKR